MSVLQTRNLKHFPAEPLLEMAIRVLDADAYLCEQLADSPEQMLITVARIASEPLAAPRSVAEEPSGEDVNEPISTLIVGESEPTSG